MRGRLATLVALAVTAGVVHADPLHELVRPVCDEPGTEVVVTVPADQAEAVGKVIHGLQTDRKGVCIQRGPIEGAWVIDGTRKAMLVGILPVGVDTQPYLQVFTPYKLIGPLKVDIAKPHAVASNNTN